MDDSALSLGTIDVSYLSNSSECSLSRCKHLNEEWGQCDSRPTVFRSASLKWKETFMSRKRPFVGRCCYVCTPQSRDKLFNASIPSLGLRNVIYINDTHTRHRGWLARRICYMLFVQERDVHKGMFANNVAENVFSSTRVQEAIEEVALEWKSLDTSAPNESKATNKVKKKAKRILQEMVANVSPAMIRLTGWVLLKLFNSFFWNIQIHKGQLEMVKAAAEMNLPLIFLPVHKSHIDYLLLTFILFCHNIKAPYIAAGNNLNIPIFSTLIHKLGGFFIRRRLDETPDGKKDILYRALLFGHIEELLRQKQFLEIFLEGTRSRSGKTSCARAGLLSVVVDTLSTNAIPDVLIIPVGISYDRIIEGHYNGEQLGKPKKNESLWSVARGVFRMLRKNYGCVRVDFAQPFSLKEYLESQSQKPVLAPLSLEQALLPAILPSRPHDIPDEGSVAAAAESTNLTDEPLRRRLIANLAEHVLFTANKSCAVMSTHIVACLLLYRHRQGIDLSKLVEDFFIMKEEVLARDFDLGFSGNSEDVVMHAIHLLGNCVTITNTSRNDEFFITPSTTIPSVFELNFYSNGVLHVFIMEAIIACSLYAILSKRCPNGANGISSNLISQEQLVRKAAGLCCLLSNEGTISLPCQTFYQVCHEAVGRFIQYGILVVAEQDDQEDISPGLPEQHWDKKLPEPLSWRSDEEDEDSDFGEEQRDCYLKVSQSKEHQEFISFLQRLLGPLLEAYSSTAIFIHNFTGPVSETEYLQKLHKYLITRTERNVAVYDESATYCLVKNAVKIFKDIGVFKTTKQKRVSVLELSNTFLPPCNRQKLLEYILSFVVL
ncbi:glycerol-3-phosphate acyltransferase 1, mitochondrial [Tachyglossus aculeatus]|uniref:glycerol-3-phosphate acyltransferase 1, mitochondrial n=1 Tax=Tachyglossus aculeatus TaxID=9261 RepID=UPI0018F6C0DE|nr:glycerol-3-phosphate acyltransferase 1, mitochondrial [Tachyglossus aculeatus]XP_038613522.1 glycerol-3-phosphate acyltransferase 1, mitochondrial [Tachyglossus aculeatus]XP_038613523.1 glycerol-3-phosphate acyltransferase 1, mitochondrial [Tachyglossus aculeatus]XP_038613524.1 glycerol-3-phosphate acyltransferase 1, mitochondrial [Tachyglossus aculeatus]XP_038613525.1 glycerol-3-phosphate acyltransferase 1, mitochondrial [Tachyglossus aculeatus]